MAVSDHWVWYNERNEELWRREFPLEISMIQKTEKERLFSKKLNKTQKLNKAHKYSLASW